ncbi:MAG: ROK family protein [Paracoccaceae bacterium]
MRTSRPAIILKSVGANAERSRNHNRQLILERIRDAGQMGRAEMARASGLSTQAVSNIIADMMGDGLILEVGRRTGARGLPAVQYGLNPGGGYAFGVEIRPDAVFAALLDLSGKTIFSARRAQTSVGPEPVTEAVVALLTQALEASGVSASKVLGAGIVLPGPFGQTGIQNSGSELSGWKGIDLSAWFQSALGLPVIIENDANAAAIAERVKGAAQALDSYAFLYFGAGLGLGWVHNGALATGAYGNAGEIGHIPVPCDGQTVLLETVVSRLSVQQALADKGIVISDGQDLQHLFERANPTLLAWLDRAQAPLSVAVATVENLLDPQAIILGGAMPDGILDYLIEGVGLQVKSVSNRVDRTVPRLIRGSSGRMTATLGAAALVINQAFTPTISLAS